MKELEVFTEDEIQHWERYTRLLAENRIAINKIVRWINKREQMAREAKRNKSSG